MSSKHLRRFASLVGIIGITGSYLTGSQLTSHTGFLATVILIAAASICEAIERRVDRTPD